MYQYIGSQVITSATYAIIASIVAALVLSWVDPVARSKVHSRDPMTYKKIVSERSLFFEKGGVSPADIGTYIRFYRYAVSSEAKAVLGKKLWLFYRLWIALYILCFVWLVFAVLV